MSGKPQKARVGIENADFPCNTELVLDLVVSYLPLKDCVRTSILSSRWRYRWTTIPSLVFNKTCYPRSCSFSIEEEGEAIASIVNHVLSRHNGSIQVFVVEAPCIVPDIDCWISRVFTDSIKTLVLGLWYSKQYTLPSSLFTCESLSCLKLIDCLLMTPPSSFKGFKNLKCLEFKEVTLTNDALEKLISPCPLLEKLTLNEIKGADRLEIDAPNLQDVCILGTFVNITFGYAMTKLPVIHIRAVECVYPSLVDLFIKLPSIRRLQLEHCYLGFMFGDSTQDGFPFHFKDLFRVAIRLGFSFPIDISPILYLCRDWPGIESEIAHSTFHAPYLLWSCEKLHSLEFLVKGFNNDNLLVSRGRGIGCRCLTLSKALLICCVCYERMRRDGREYSYLAIELGAWEDDDDGEWDYDFKRLQSVTMDDFRGTSTELEFAEYVLGSSPVLEEVIVNPSGGIRWRDIKSVFELWRPPGAKVILDRRLTQIRSDRGFLLHSHG